MAVVWNEGIWNDGRPCGHEGLDAEASPVAAGLEGACPSAQGGGPGDWAADMPAPANVPVAPGEGFAVAAADLPLERDDAAGFGTVSWRTLICGDRTPSSGLVLGVAEFGPGDTLLPHRHGPAEVYFGLEGSGTVTIEGRAHRIAPGIAVYLPSDAEHDVVAGEDGLRFVYGFPTARFAEVDYRFTRR